jgi:H+-transporting ATPase
MLISGALIRRGETVGQVIATGERTKFGSTAELVRTAALESSQQKTVLPIITATKWQGAS